MEIFRSIVDTVGETPIVRLNRTVGDLPVVLLAKLEFLNPGGSIKDRIGHAMLEDAEQRGLIGPGSVIVEPTSGNTGVGLAIAAVAKGYKMIFTMPDKMSLEKIRLLEAYGAKVIIAPTAVPLDDPRHYIRVAERLTKETPNAFMPNQYSNEWNPRAHYETTGPEIWRQTDGRFDALVAGVGTGGSISGIGKYIKERKPQVKIIGVDPEGSIFYDNFHGARSNSRPYTVEGIGEDFVPKVFDEDIVDDMVRVSDKDSFLMARRLAREEGLLTGGASGAVVHAALAVASNMPRESTLVAVLTDRGERYLSRIYSDEWMRDNNFIE